MAISNATRLSDFGSGIGTQGAVLNVNNTNKTVGIGTTDPQAMLQVGQNITMDGGASGVITATSFVGSGVNLTGVSGFGTAMDSTQGTLGNLIYKTPRFFHQTGVTSAYVDSGTTSGKMAYTRLAEIIVGGAATMHIGAGVTMIMNVLNIF